MLPVDELSFAVRACRCGLHVVFSLALMREVVGQIAHFRAEQLKIGIGQIGHLRHASVGVQE